VVCSFTDRCIRQWGKDESRSFQSKANKKELDHGVGGVRLFETYWW